MSGLGGFLQIFGGGPPNFWEGGGCSSKFSRGGGSPPEYGQRLAGTHPTGMHSCFTIFQLGDPSPNLNQGEISA